MGGFPALPSGNNPSVSAAGESSRAAATVYDRLQSRLQQAANQHATRLRQAELDKQTAHQRELADNQRNFEDQLQLAGKNAISTNLPQIGDRGTGHDGVTLQRPESNPAVPENGKGQTVTTPRGEKYYIPTEQEQGKTYVPTAGLGAALQSGGAWDGKTPMTAAHSHALMQALNEAQKQFQDEGFDIDTSGKFTDQQGNPMPVMIGKKTGKVTMMKMDGTATQTPAAPAQQGGAPGGAFTAQPQAAPAPVAQPVAPGSTVAPGPPAQPTTAPPAAGPRAGGLGFALPEKNEPTDQQTVIPGKKGPKGGMIVWNKKTKTTEEVPYPAGTSDELTANQKETDKDRHTRMAEASTRQGEVNEARTARLTAAYQALENRAAQDHEKAGQKKEAMQAMAQGFYDAGGVQPGETYFPPRYQNGIVVPGQATIMPADKDQAAARAKELKKTAQGFEKTAKTHQGEQERIEKQHGWGKFAAPQPAPQGGSPAQGAQTPAAPAAAQPAAGQQKSASLANIRAYAQKNGISEADALRKAKAEGYSIGQ